VLTGSLAGTSAASVASGANLEVDGLLNNGITASVTGQLSGTGSVGGVTIQSGGVLAPALNSIPNTTGTLAANNTVTFTDNTSIFSIRLGVASPLDADQLAVNSGSVLLNDATLQLTLGGAFNRDSEPADTLYAIISGGASATGSLSDVFANATASGDVVSDNFNDVFEVFYGVSPTSISTPGSDVDLEFISIPEPGTWASVLGGLGILSAWQAARRRRRV
jgi:hypothetical protein